MCEQKKTLSGCSTYAHRQWLKCSAEESLSNTCCCADRSIQCANHTVKNARELPCKRCTFNNSERYAEPEPERKADHSTDVTDGAVTSVASGCNAADVPQNRLATRRVHLQDHCLVLVREQVRLDSLLRDHARINLCVNSRAYAWLLGTSVSRPTQCQLRDHCKLVELKRLFRGCAVKSLQQYPLTRWYTSLTRQETAKTSSRPRQLIPAALKTMLCAAWLSHQTLQSLLWHKVTTSSSCIDLAWSGERRRASVTSFNSRHP